MTAVERLAMTDVLEELTADSLTRDHVEERLTDWQTRIRSLYGQIGSWLQIDAAIMVRIIENAVSIHEEPMRETGVDARMLPALDVIVDGEPRARLEPRGLWIIGSNGRLDLMIGVERHIIVDTAENFAASVWTIMPASDRTVRTRLTREGLLAVLDR